jgi:hypothetical protein
MRGATTGVVCLVVLAWGATGCRPGGAGRVPESAASGEDRPVVGVADAPAREYRLEPSGTAADRAPRSGFVAWSPDGASGLDAPLLAADLTAAVGSGVGVPATAGPTDWGVGYGTAEGILYSTALGNDPVDARGLLLGSECGDAYGTSGLGMLGTETGGGGSNAVQGYGLGDVALAGRGGRTPELRLEDATTYGGLSREVIRRVVQQQRARLRLCYETARASTPEAAAG